MKHGKRALVLATAAMMTLSVSACSSGGGQGAASEINLWIPTDSSGSTGKYVDAYNEAHPETKVVLREIPFANYDSALNQAFNAKTGPDLGVDQRDELPDLRIAWISRAHHRGCGRGRHAGCQQLLPEPL